MNQKAPHLSQILFATMGTYKSSKLSTILPAYPSNIPPDPPKMYEEIPWFFGLPRCGVEPLSMPVVQQPAVAAVQFFGLVRSRLEKFMLEAS